MSKFYLKASVQKYIRDLQINTSETQVRILDELFQFSSDIWTWLMIP